MVQIYDYCTVTIIERIHRRLGIADSIILDKSGINKDLVSPTSLEYTPLLCSR